MYLKKGKQRQSDRYGNHTETLRPQLVRFWEKQKVLTEKTLEERSRLEGETRYCSVIVGTAGEPCGKLSHYKVERAGFCREVHQAEAYKAQQEHWKTQVRFIKTFER